MRHIFGANEIVEFLRREVAQFKRGFTQTQMLVMRFVRDFGGFIVANFWAESRNEHQRILDILFDALPIDFHADDAVVGERPASVG